MSEANRAAVAALAQVRPAWRRIVPAGDVVERRGRWLLHAGPPFRDSTRPAAPILNSARLACIHEGWAATAETAAALIAGGSVELVPAQEHGVVLPLAAIASPRSTLVEVVDRAAPARRAWSILASGAAGPQIRFGTADPGVLERLSFRDGALAASCSAVLDAPIDLLPIAHAGIQGGDDLHGRTTAATAMLATRRLPEPLAQTVATTPLFFLTLWMAACACMARVLADHAGASLVTALCGNGEQVAIARADRPGQWLAASAGSPHGPLPPGLSPGDIAGAVGDSGIVDALGFGGQIAHRAPELAGHFGALLPSDVQARHALYAGKHSTFADVPFGLDAARVAATGTTPLVVIAMLRRPGGLAGRGLYRPPASIFA